MGRAAAAAMILVACSAGTGTTTTAVIGDGADSSVAAVEQLRVSLADGDFATAASLAVPGQAALVSLGEGATTGDVAESLDEGDAAIAANFWEGFAQGAGDAFAGEVSIEEMGTTIEGDVEFYLVAVTPDSGIEQRIVTRDVDGQRIDLFASFGAGMAEGLMSPVELLLGSSNADAGVVLAALHDVVPSLLVAASDQSLSPDASQRVLQLVELITRVG